MSPPWRAALPGAAAYRRGRRVRVRDAGHGYDAFGMTARGVAIAAALAARFRQLTQVCVSCHQVYQRPGGSP